MDLNACILVKTTPTHTDGVLDAVRKLTGVKKAYIAYGRYDLIAFATATDYPGIRKLTSLVNSLAGVRSTETLVEA
jgi:DNA-binding Lrp family transcriptional regulator